MIFARWIDFRFLRGMSTKELVIALAFLTVFFGVLYLIAHLTDKRKRQKS
jgi:hypothetical protein